MNSENAIASRTTVAYVAGLLLIATLSGAIHVLLDRVIEQQNDTGTVINIAGRQRMLSQRIALLASDLHEGDVSARQRLIDATRLMVQSEDALIHGNDLGIHTPLSPAAHRYYFEGAGALDPSVRSFTAASRRFAESTDPDASEKDFQSIQFLARSSLLPALDRAVSIFERESKDRISWLRFAQKIVLAVILVTLLLEALLIFRPLVKRIKHYASNLYQLATRDELTGLANRRHFIEYATTELRHARRSGHQLCLIILDLDNFKSINDTFGHAVGDDILRRFAEISVATLRQDEMMCRIGGEEFAFIMTETDAVQGLIVAERLRCAVADDAGEGLPKFTISLGVGVLQASDNEIYDLMKRTDAALYTAKADGRNRVAIKAEGGEDALPFRQPA